MLADLVAFVQRHRLRPRVGRVFDIAEAPAAFAHAMAGGTLGKIVIAG
jgi:NADPH:quinone reductase-like Zn-dependent oxidoreductase